MKCLDCGNDEGTLLKEFNSEKNYSWYELSEMTEVCASCGSENIKTGIAQCSDFFGTDIVTRHIGH